MLFPYSNRCSYCRAFHSFRKYHTLVVRNPIFRRRRHRQITSSLSKTFLTRQLQWCFRCCSASTQVLRRLGWLKPSRVSPLWSLQMRCSQRLQCRDFKVSRFSKTRCSSPMPRNRQFGLIGSYHESFVSVNVTSSMVYCDLQGGNFSFFCFVVEFSYNVTII